jgi:hypothetical protein
MTTTGKPHSPQFKARVAIEASRGQWRKARPSVVPAMPRWSGRCGPSPFGSGA